MLLVVLHGPSHSGEGHGGKESLLHRIQKVFVKDAEDFEKHMVKSERYENLDVYARYVNFDVGVYANHNVHITIHVDFNLERERKTGKERARERERKAEREKERKR